MRIFLLVFSCGFVTFVVVFVVVGGSDGEDYGGWLMILVGSHSNPHHYDWERMNEGNEHGYQARM